MNAGPTREYLDPVRFISNPSSGKMGFALAAAAQARGANVTLVTGPVSLPTPPGVRRVDVESAQDMLKACGREFGDCDIFIASAAVGDYLPVKKSNQKMKKDGNRLEISLRPNVDVLQTLSAKKKNGQILVGFAAETDELIRHAKEKLKKKKLDLIVANDVSKSEGGFASDKNAVVLIDSRGKTEKIPLLSKAEVAEKILDRLEKTLPGSKGL